MSRIASSVISKLHHMPTLLDLTIMCGLGFVWAAWMYFMTRAYSIAQASAVAPFEYASLPINVMWGFIIWREIPTLMTWAGACLTLLSGILIMFRERLTSRAKSLEPVK